MGAHVCEMAWRPRAEVGVSSVAVHLTELGLSELKAYESSLWSQPAVKGSACLLQCTPAQLPALCTGSGDRIVSPCWHRREALYRMSHFSSSLAPVCDSRPEPCKGEISSLPWRTEVSLCGQDSLEPMIKPLPRLSLMNSLLPLCSNTENKL